MEEFNRVYKEFMEDISTTYKRIKVGELKESEYDFFKVNILPQILKISRQDYESLEQCESHLLPNVKCLSVINTDSITFVKNKKTILKYFETMYILATTIDKPENQEEHQEIISNFVKIRRMKDDQTPEGIESILKTIMENIDENELKQILNPMELMTMLTNGKLSQKMIKFIKKMMDIVKGQLPAGTFPESEENMMRDFETFSKQFGMASGTNKKKMKKKFKKHMKKTSASNDAPNEAKKES